MWNLPLFAQHQPYGQLTITRFWPLREPTVRPVHIQIVPLATPAGSAAAHFIQCIYQQKYAASIEVSYPHLMVLYGQNDQILAAAGFREAAEEPLFLEQYLGQPIESLLDASRQQIVEIGNLASAGGGASLFLFAALASYLNHKGYVHAVVTSTKQLEKRFTLLGLRPRRLAVATAEALTLSAQSWGGYYATEPQVMAGRIDKSARRLGLLFGITLQGTHQTATYVKPSLAGALS